MRRVAPFAIFAVLACVPILPLGAESGFAVSLFARVMVFALAAVSLDLILGAGGMVSFGHAAFIAVGAYAVAILDERAIDEAWAVLPAACAGAAIFALATGVIALRTRGVNFIMITLAFAQMVFFGAGSLADYGGDDGYTLVERTRLFGLKIMAGRGYYWTCFVLLLAGYALCRVIVASRFGRVLRAIRQNRERVQALGFDPFAVQLVAYVIAAMICAVAGVLLANGAEFVVARLRRLAALGRPADHGDPWRRGQPARRDTRRRGSAAAGGSAWPGDRALAAVFGPLLVLVRAVPARRAGRDRGTTCLSRCWRCASYANASARSLVTDRVSLTISAATIHALIGPNGAGKTSLIHQVSGILAPDAGAVLLEGRDITRLKLHRRARLGLVRSFQITSVLPDFSALDNVALAVQASIGSVVPVLPSGGRRGAAQCGRAGPTRPCGHRSEGWDFGTAAESRREAPTRTRHGAREAAARAAA